MENLKNQIIEILKREYPNNAGIELKDTPEMDQINISISTPDGEYEEIRILIKGIS